MIPKKPADVFVVELFPYDELIGTPPNIDRIRKRLIHAKFWHKPADAASPILIRLSDAQRKWR